MSLLRSDILRGGVLGTARSLRDGFLEMAWPTRCVGCDMPGELLCPDCRDALPLIDPAAACPRCGAPHGFLICTECWTPEGLVEYAFSRAVCALEFEGVAAKMVVAFKDGGELRVANLIALLIHQALAAAGAEDLGALVPVPATPSALHRRGYDHVDLIARPLSELLGIGLRDVLVSRDVSDQRGLGRVQRDANMREAFSTRRDSEPLPRRVLLVDDVFTTGATLDAAAGVLLEAGAEEVVAAAACRVW
ncbi:MAG: ComF family protein [Coriobacteriales bacterium]|jgi:ComF family protein